MPDEPHLFLYGALLLGAGHGSGFAGGLFGIGGGVLRVPIFLYLFPVMGFDPTLVMHLAAGTSLALAVPTGLRSALSQQRAGHLDGAFLRSWIPSLLLGVLAGLVAMRFVPGTALVGVFGVAMLLAAADMIALPPDVRLAHAVPGQPVRGALAGAIGALSTMIGVSGGAFTTPALTLLGAPIHRAVAISAASGAAIAALGTIGSVVNGLGVAGRPGWSLGYVDLLAFAVMLPAILISAPLGVKLANHLDERRLRRSFGVFLLIVAVDMLRRALG